MPEAKRITNALNTGSADDGQKVVSCGPEYSTVCPFNADKTLVLVLYRSYFALHDGNTGAFLKTLPLEMHARSCPRWNPHDPYILYFFEGILLQRYDARTDHIDTVHAFTEYQSIGNGGESDISEDGHHLVISGNESDIFLWDLVANRKSAILMTDGRWNALYVTPDNNVLITWNADTGRGIQLWRPDSTVAPRTIAPILSHQDVGRDSDGSEILVWANSPDPSVNNNGVEKIRLADGKRTLLHPFGWDKDNIAASLIFHIGCPKANTNYAIVETWDKTNPNSSKPYANAILRVWLDGEVEEIAKHHSFGKTYEGQPKTAASRDGTKLLFASNGGITDPEGYSDAYLLDLTRETVDPSPPPPAPVPRPAPAPAPALQPPLAVTVEFPGFTKTDFRYAEGKEWLVRFKVVNGQLTSEIWEKG